MVNTGGIEITVEKEQVSRDLKKGAKEPISKGLGNLALKMEAALKKGTVVDTGRSRAAWTRRVTQDTAVLGNNVQYSPFWNYGTQKMEPRHMEGSNKILGQGTTSYVIEQMDDDIKAFGAEVVENVKRQVEG